MNQNNFASRQKISPPVAAWAADHLNKHGLGDTMLRNQHQISIKCDSWSRQWRFYEDIPGHRLLLHVDIQWTMSVENNKTVLITYNNNNNSSHHVMLPNKSFCKIHFLVFASPFLNVWKHFSRSNYIYHASYWYGYRPRRSPLKLLDICTISWTFPSQSQCAPFKANWCLNISYKKCYKKTLCASAARFSVWWLWGGALCKHGQHRPSHPRLHSWGNDNLFESWRWWSWEVLRGR